MTDSAYDDSETTRGTVAEDIIQFLGSYDIPPPDDDLTVRNIRNYGYKFEIGACLNARNRAAWRLTN
jgi:hypothetical protein